MPEFELAEGPYCELLYTKLNMEKIIAKPPIQMFKES
jgi:hypothetical protein